VSQSNNIKEQAIEALLLLPKEEKEKVIDFIANLVRLETLKNEQRTP